MIGALIIGDEIIRGKRQDKHFAKLVELLRARGMRLDWSQYLGDNRQLVIDTLKRTLASGDLVFSFGGIGATPDDHTRQAAAAVAGVELKLHPEAERIMRERFGDQASEYRLRMGEFPVGSGVIPNPYNNIPGFSFKEHYFVPGFPVMAWPMVEWVLDTHYRHLFNAVPEADDSITVYGLPESAITPLMQDVEARHTDLKTFSLPSVGEDGLRRHIELGARGAPGSIAAAMNELRAGVKALGGTWDERK